jgi:hypothetical protein
MKFTRSYRIPLIPSSTIKIWGLLRLNLFTMRTGSVWTQGIIEGRRIIWRRRATWLKNARSWKRRLFLQTISNQWKSLRRCIWRIPPTLQRQITSESLLVLKARLRRCWRRRRDARFRSGAKAHRRLRRWSWTLTISCTCWSKLTLTRPCRKELMQSRSCWEVRKRTMQRRISDYSCKWFPECFETISASFVTRRAIDHGHAQVSWLGHERMWSARFVVRGLIQLTIAQERMVRWLIQYVARHCK